MEDSRKRAELLIDRYLSGELTTREVDAFDAAYLAAANKQQLPELSEHDIIELNKIGKESLSKLLTDIKVERHQGIKLWPRVRIAAGIAAAVATIVFGVWFFTAGHLDSSSSRTAGRDLNDVAPGHSGATITYSTGEVIQLDSTKTGVQINPTSLTYNDGSVISSAARDLLNSKDKGSLPGVEMTASTSKGQTYVFTLPDGTKVWLNAATTLKFPSTFANAKTRNVEVSGEAYFEVFRNKSQPFVVKTKKLGDIPEQDITVLGTRFNVNSYADEGKVATTLLEGSVRVSSSSLASSSLRAERSNPIDGGDITLIPGQQSILTNNSIKVKSADLEEEIAWKNGYFRFNEEHIETVMRKLARWYNISVVYRGQITNEKFTGTVNRDKNISEALLMLEQTKGVHFKIEGRRVTVIK